MTRLEIIPFSDEHLHRRPASCWPRATPATAGPAAALRLYQDVIFTYGLYWALCS